MSKFNDGRIIRKIKNIVVGIEEKAKGTIFENWVKSWRNAFFDYKDVVIDIKTDIVNRPIKSVCILTFLGSLAYCAKHNPDLKNYRNHFISCANELLLVHPNMLNKNTIAQLQQIQVHFTRSTIRRLDLGVACVIWEDYYSSECHNSEADCKYMQMPIFDFKNHIVDVGFLNRWWILTKAMENYDINY